MIDTGSKTRKPKSRKKTPPVRRVTLSEADKGPMRRW